MMLSKLVAEDDGRSYTGSQHKSSPLVSGGTGANTEMSKCQCASPNIWAIAVYAFAYTYG